VTPVRVVAVVPVYSAISALTAKAPEEGATLALSTMIDVAAIAVAPFKRVDAIRVTPVSDISVVGGSPPLRRKERIYSRFARFNIFNISAFCTPGILVFDWSILRSADADSMREDARDMVRRITYALMSDLRISK